MSCDVTWLRELVRWVPDFPKTGVRFADIGPLLADSDAFRCAVELLADEYVGAGVDLVAGIDARGFILGAPVAARLGCGFVPMRKSGHLPGPKIGCEYELEYDTATLEVSSTSVESGQKVVIIDDVLATGGTAGASVKLLESVGAEVVGLGFLLAIAGLNGAACLGGHEYGIALGDL